MYIWRSTLALSSNTMLLPCFIYSNAWVENGDAQVEYRRFQVFEVNWSINKQCRGRIMTLQHKLKQQTKHFVKCTNFGNASYTKDKLLLKPSVTRTIAVNDSYPHHCAL